MRNLPLLPKQLVFVADDRKVVAARGGVGSGKTVSSAWWLIRETQKYPKARFGAVGASFTQLDFGFFTTLRGLLEKHKIAFVYTTSPRPKLRLTATGAVIESFSAEQREKIRSLEVDRVVVEEPQTWEGGRETFLTLVERLRPSPNAVEHYPGLSPQIRLTFNPPPVGHWLHDQFEKQWAGIYPCFRMSLRENTILHRIDPAYLPFLLETIPKDRHPREIDGHWGTVATGPYRGFDASRHTIEMLRADCPQQPIAPPLPSFALDPNKRLRWALDFNVEWMASTISQLHVQPLITRFVPGVQPGTTSRIDEPSLPAYQSRVCYTFDEIFIRDAGVQNVVAEFLRRHGDHARRAGVTIYGDASGGGRSPTVDSASSARSPWAIILRDLRAAGVRDIQWRVQRANPPIVDRLNAVREWFDTNGRVGFITTSQGCPELINDFNLVQFVPGKNEIDKSDKSEEGLKRTHLSDGIGYMLWVEYELARRPDSINWSLVR